MKSNGESNEDTTWIYNEEKPKRWHFMYVNCHDDHFELVTCIIIHNASFLPVYSTFKTGWTHSMIQS